MVWICRLTDGVDRLAKAAVAQCSQRSRLAEKSAGHVFMSDGGDTVVKIARDMAQASEHLLD